MATLAPSQDSRSMLQSFVEMGRTVALVAGLVLLIGVVSHVLAWVLTRRRTIRWVWGYWNVLGAALLAIGVAAIAYGWLALGLHTGFGSIMAGLGLLLASAGLWMLVPV